MAAAVSHKEDPKKSAIAHAEEEDEEDDVPELEEIKPDTDEEVMGNRAGKQSRSQRRYQKAMAKMGLKPENGVIRVTIRKAKSIMFAISQPEVYKYPGSDTFIIFGEASIEDTAQDAQKAAVRHFTQAASDAASAKPEAPAADDDEGDVSAEGLEEKDIELVMTQAMVNRNKAIKALKANQGDIVNTIMSLTM